jgi:two-component system chemotaxis sensor kinase CheA
MEDMDEVVQEFLVESHENLDRLDREFVELESDPTSRPLLASIFRTIHTIKGTAGFLGYDNLQSVTHVGENLLSLLRDGSLQLTESRTSSLLKMVDAIRTMLDTISERGNDGDDPYTELVAELTEQCQGAGARVSRRAAAAAAAVVEASTEPAALDVLEAVAGPVATPDAPAAPEPAGVASEAPAPAAEPVSPDAPARAGTSDAPPTAETHRPAAETSIRVDVKLLDQLMNLVGELVLARNQILQYAGQQEDASLVATSQQLNLITTELQEGVMKTRMQPIGSVWSKFPRVVRDLAVACGKKVRIEMEGEDTELDRTILEAIKDPLTHVVRNAVDHGIESPEARIAAGKPADGTLRLRAYHDGGQVVIEIIDDGGGVDCEKVRKKAVDRGIISPQQAAKMSEREVAHLIFEPGFSTADKISNISGRGVGMDVVKTNVEKIGGSVDVQSTQGRGMTLTVKIPLTLAIIPALIVTVDGHRYAIPQVNLVELIRIEQTEANRGIEYVGNAPVFRLRGRLLPIVWLRDVLRLAPSNDQTVHNVVVIQSDDRQFGLVVDNISDTEEIVVKPLGPHFKSIEAFAGTTIMGDGTVALILDVIGIARQGALLSEERHMVSAEEQAQQARKSESQTVLVCMVGGQRIAIPLSLVARLEEFPRNQIEKAAGREVVQYRGRLLHLVSLAQFLGVYSDHGYSDGHERALQVLVYSENERTFGFVVDEIVDVVDADFSTVEHSDRPGVPFSAVIGRRVTDLVDVDALIRSVVDGQLAMSSY